MISRGKRPSDRELYKIKSNIFCNPGISEHTLLNIIHGNFKNEKILKKFKLGLEILEKEWKVTKFEKNGWYPENILQVCFLCNSNDIIKKDENTYICNKCKAESIIVNRPKDFACPICRKNNVIKFIINDKYIGYYCNKCNKLLPEQNMIKIL